jgi:hypothetical protein
VKKTTVKITMPPPERRYIFQGSGAAQVERSSTARGFRLRELRERIVASGVELLSEEEINSRRGDI